MKVIAIILLILGILFALFNIPVLFYGDPAPDVAFSYKIFYYIGRSFGFIAGGICITGAVLLIKRSNQKKRKRAALNSIAADGRQSSRLQ